MIATETVILIKKEKTGVDEFNVPVFSLTEIPVKNVVVGSPSFDLAVNELNLTGKRLAFILGIPKGDTHNWADTTVIIRGQKFRTYGMPMLQTNDNVPGPWNLQVKVEKYE